MRKGGVGLFFKFI
uniref:UORF n=1 Tax=Trypanosoma cruzi TaxID=5693 RepID=A0A076JK03_TRYCR|nr:uORF [Trypanosoma cruzi]AII77635.1 uORF [Trypanosoma cruzi]AII77640.1 uORF [Trypanosoma cruzi]AII77645.1 uORF [Trypanosoma cruzi]